MRTERMKEITQTSSKRLLFDRRYGWVIDEWKEPSKEALAGGRGMFCVIPLTAALFKMATQSINVAARSMEEVFQRPEPCSPHLMQAGLSNGIKKVLFSLKKSDINSFFLKGKLSSLDSSGSGASHVQMGNTR